MQHPESEAIGMKKPSLSAAETRSTASHQRISAIEPLVTTLTVVTHPDSRRVGEVATLSGLMANEEVLLSRMVPDFGPQGSPANGPLADDHLSREPLILVRGATGEVVLRRAGSRTRVDVDGERFADERSLSAAELDRGVVLVLGRRVVLLLHLHPPLAAPQPDYGMVGESNTMRRLRATVQAVADLRVPVLLRGESGTGKELLARAIHDAGPRRSNRYLAVNIAAVPQNLATTELFGAARGAYTGADRRRSGFFQRAAGGTLFLDEIGDTPAEVQPMLLRALENGEIQPVGGSEIHRVDVRVVAATDADLEQAVVEGRFSRPLLHRLAGYEIRVPALRERRADFGRLLYHFLRQELAEIGMEDALDHGGERPWPPAELVAHLATRDWPGNVRELKNVARRLVIERRTGLPGSSLEILGGGSPTEQAAGSLDASEVETAEKATLDSYARAADVRSPEPPAAGSWRPVYRKPGDVSEDELLDALRQHRFELKPTAEALGVSRGTLYNLVAKCPRVRKAAELERAEIEAALATADGDLEAVAVTLEVSFPGLKRRMKALGLR